MYSQILSLAKSLGCRAYENAPMREYTSFKVGGNAALLVMPNSADSLGALLAACRRENIKTYVIGNGSNILVSDKGLDGVVLRIAGDFAEAETLGDGKIRCDAGISLGRLCSFALSHGLTGLEFAYGIPGTAGGAAYMNAGAYGGEMKQVLLSCTHIAPDGSIGSLSGEELALGYRKSAYTENGCVITSLLLQLQEGDQAEIKAQMEDKMQRRKEKQPLEYPSAGSTFKRPEGNFAGALIEGCSLKGKSVGGAQVSEKHAGFIINKGGAKAADICDLIALVQETVYREKGIFLETEVKYFE